MHPEFGHDLTGIAIESVRNRQHRSHSWAGPVLTLVLLVHFCANLLPDGARASFSPDACWYLNSSTQRGVTADPPIHHPC